MKQTTIEFHIGEVLLYNLPYEQRHLIAAAIEQELQRLLNEQGLPPSLAEGGSIPDLRIDHFQVEQHGKAEKIGAQIGQAVYQRLLGHNEAAQFVVGERSGHPNGVPTGQVSVTDRGHTVGVPATLARKNLKDNW